jgi:dihydropyrimidinase
MGTLIKNGIVVTASDTFRADVRVVGGRVAELGAALDRPGDEIVDAAGCYVMPGAIDAHTHLDMPFMGTCSTDDFQTGTIAAAFGGTTSIIDFVVPTRGQPRQAAVEAWRAKADGKTVLDYGLHCCVVELTDRTLGEMEALVRKGITSFKLFTAYPGALMVDDGAIFRALRWSTRHGALIQVHCENGPAIVEIVGEMIAQRKTDPVFHALSRPSQLEGEATARTIALAEVAGAPIYIVHLTCCEALAAVRDARRRGLPVFGETCPQYLYLSLEDLARPDFEGAKYVCSPPLRPKHHAEELWRALAAGELQTVATDHCPFHFKELKEMGRGDFRTIPNGLPAIETRVLLMHQGVVDGKLNLNRFVDAVSTAPAKIFGLYPRKGAIVPGADADLVIWSPEKLVDLSHRALHMRVDYSIYEGKSVRGGPEKVYCRGQLVVDGATFLGQPGQGRFLAREPFTAARVV